jgi:hypothetical protein
MTERTTDVSNWLFQGNPKKFPVLDHLLDGQKNIAWSVTQHLGDVSVNDDAVLWVSGSGSGVYAIGHVAGPLFKDVAGDDWLDPADRGKERHFCPLRWSEIRVDHPILKTDMLAAGGFDQARIIRQPMAGNPMKLTDEEWAVIERLR